MSQKASIKLDPKQVRTCFDKKAAENARHVAKIESVKLLLAQAGAPPKTK